ncbi:MAG TPA: shikimate dehydrogenase [Caulobacteraceae bacterium]|jgi:shikimate dehydrogenase
MSGSATLVAGVVGSPIGHSLSPAIHGAWIRAAGLEAVYLALEPGDFTDLIRRKSGEPNHRGFNVTAPFKEEALALASNASERARRAGSANLLIFEGEGRIRADNTDGEGLLAAFAEQAPGFDPAAGPVVIIGAGGAARGAAAAFGEAGAPAVRLVARSPEKAAATAASLGGVVSAADFSAAVRDANAIINATPAAPSVALEAAPASAVVMDMVYRPVTTPFLAHARAAGLTTVDGLAMLIGQARPSFTALFGVAPPDVDVRKWAILSMDLGV